MTPEQERTIATYVIMTGAWTMFILLGIGVYLA